MGRYVFGDLMLVDEAIIPVCIYVLFYVLCERRIVFRSIHIPVSHYRIGLNDMEHVVEVGLERMYVEHLWKVVLCRHIEQ